MRCFRCDTNEAITTLCGSCIKWNYEQDAKLGNKHIMHLEECIYKELYEPKYIPLLEALFPVEWTKTEINIFSSDSLLRSAMLDWWRDVLGPYCMPRTLTDEAQFKEFIQGYRLTMRRDKDDK